MGLKSATAVSLADIAASLDPNGKVATLIEIMNKKNAILDDIRFLEGNLPTGNKTNIRSGLPAVVWRKFNYGVPADKSRAVAVTDVCGMLEARAEIDQRLAELGGNAPAYRMSQDKAFIEAMGQELVSTMFYGNTDTAPEKFMGLAPRYADTTAENGENIFLGDGEGATNTSLWLVVHGDAVFGIYPKGTQAGLKMEDLGLGDLLDANGNKYRGYSSLYQWDVGLTVADWRFISRGANIDVSKLTKDANAGTDLLDLMTDMCEAIYAMDGGTPVFYANRTITSFLKKQIRNKGNMFLSYEDVTGPRGAMKQLTFQGIPIKRSDALLNTEAAIS